MKFLNSIKQKLGKRKIEKFLLNQRRRPNVSNFENARSIGLVYSISTTDYQDIVERYVNFLKGEIGFKKIVVLGYYEGTKLPSFIVNQSLRYQYFTNKMVDFYYQGNCKEVTNFIKEDFDILIDLSKDFEVPIKHAVAHSKSKFKIGRLSDENKKYYDFMVEMPPNTPVTKFITQVNLFLTQVKPK
ncbi:MAG: hypothetical protein ABF238_01720 [Flavobacteriales bacterium]